MKKSKTPVFAKVGFSSNTAIEKRLKGTWITEVKEEYAKLSIEMMEEMDKEPKYVQ